MAGGRVTSFLCACSTDAEIVQHETRKVQNYTVFKKPDPYDILARSRKVAERAICFTLRNFFLFYSSSSLMISRRQIISGCAGPIFAIFSPNESILGVDY